MFVARTASSAFLAALLLSTPAATAAPVEWPDGVRGSVPLTQEMVADEKPPPVKPPNPSETPTDTQLEELVRHAYLVYESTMRQSGNDIRFRLWDFQTLHPRQFGEHLWLDLLPPDAGPQIVQERTYFDAPWVRVGKVVHHELRWVPSSENRRENAALEIAMLQGATIREALAIDRSFSKRRIDPVTITTYRVDVVFQGQERKYRAAAFVYPQSQAADDLTVEIDDPVVRDLRNALPEDVLPVTQDELRKLMGSELDQSGRSAGASTTQSCLTDSKQILHGEMTPLRGTEGHHEGAHQARLEMGARCDYTSDCRVRCDPSIRFTDCGEVDNPDLPIFCSHTPWVDKAVSAASAANKAVTCGAALGCGIKECCGFSCGGVSISFSGSGGGLTASASNEGGGKTYNLSMSDSIECQAPAPVQDDPEEEPETLNPDENTEDPLSTSPIVIDLDRGGFRFTDLAGGVRFDLDGDGHAERVSWLAAGSGDAWLALDRNGNGIIDSGLELFGDATPQPPSSEPHGYAALAVYDRPEAGGDGDGAITPADAVFASLLLWIDADGDGVSQPHELVPLAASQVRAIELDFVASGRRDRHGNELRYTGTVHLVRGTTRSADVFLLVEP